MIFVSDFLINKKGTIFVLFHRSLKGANEPMCMWKLSTYLKGCARVRSLLHPAWETPQPFSGTRLVAATMVLCRTSKKCCRPLREATGPWPCSWATATLFSHSHTPRPPHSPLVPALSPPFVGRANIAVGSWQNTTEIMTLYFICKEFTDSHPMRTLVSNKQTNKKY